MKRRVEGNRLPPEDSGPARRPYRPEDIRALVEQTPFVTEAVKRQEGKCHGG